MTDKKPMPKQGNNFRQIGEVANEVVRDLEAQIKAIKKRGTLNGKRNEQSKR